MILLYHHVAPLETVPPQWESNEGWHFVHTPIGFERQMIKLEQSGYRFIPLAGLVDDLCKRGSEGPRTAAVTFDDGWIDNYQFALPILKKLSIPATFFVTTRQLQGGTSDAKRMNVGQLRELLRAGMAIGAHTRTHPNLTNIPAERAGDEIRGSKADLEAALDVRVDFFAYPGGAFNRQVVEAVRQAGFVAACSVLSPARNTTGSMFWLFRNLITEEMTTLSDYYRLSPLMVRLLEFRIRRRLQKQLDLTNYPSPGS